MHAHHTTVWFLTLLIVLALLYIGWRTGQLRKLRGALGGMRMRSELRGVRVGPFALLPTALLLIVIAILLISRG